VPTLAVPALAADRRRFPTCIQPRATLQQVSHAPHHFITRYSRGLPCQQRAQPNASICAPPHFFAIEQLRLRSRYADAVAPDISPASLLLPCCHGYCLYRTMILVWTLCRQRYQAHDTAVHIAATCIDGTHSKRWPGSAGQAEHMRFTILHGTCEWNRAAVGEGRTSKYSTQ
jgi:hypothetical protein